MKHTAQEYNDFIEEMGNEAFPDVGMHGKVVPYIGWFWRKVPFPDIALGFTDTGYKGFMENNKWDYHERMATKEETDKILAFLDEAMEAPNQLDILNRLNEYIQGLPHYVPS